MPSAARATRYRFCPVRRGVIPVEDVRPSRSPASRAPRLRDPGRHLLRRGRGRVRGPVPSVRLDRRRDRDRLPAPCTAWAGRTRSRRGATAAWPGPYGVAIGGLFAGESMFHRGARRVEGRALGPRRAALRRARRAPAARRAVAHAPPRHARRGRDPRAAYLRRLAVALALPGQTSAAGPARIGQGGGHEDSTDDRRLRPRDGGLVGCGGSDSGGSDSGGGMPTDASTSEFCQNFKDLTTDLGKVDPRATVRTRSRRSGCRRPDGVHGHALGHP